MTPLVVMFIIWSGMGNASTATIPGFYSVQACMDAKEQVAKVYAKYSTYTLTLECHTIG